ncbi:hypothetical protein Tsubulata_041892 [Turnera subulata]|uniref:non-specific serine/threonine protein kinase n=1 Tax=Turnera subulata TaxID=218843 RepID=A0A9Q0FFH9_9ROSI|nr:hypothetical protein Tsubulata_041892 [Turnera subulata]
MDFLSFNITTTVSFSSSILIIIFLSSYVPFINSLSTIAISETSNQTLVCALVRPPSANHSSLNCSSSSSSGIRIPVNPNISFSGVVAGDGFVCGLMSTFASTSTMVCWRFSANGTNMVYKRIYQGPALAELEAGNSHVCGLVNDSNLLECWQWPEFDPRSVTQNFSSVVVGEDFLCGLSSSGSVACPGSGIGQVPEGNYSVIAAGFRHACGLSTIGNELVCWGDVVGEVPQGEFISLALGENHSCALRANETVVCWGQNNFSLPGRFENAYFSSIEAKRRVFCGVLKLDYSLHCWGNENLDSNSLVFENVLPGPCRSSCPYGILDGSGNYCPEGQHICENGESNVHRPPAIPPSPPPITQPDRGSGDEWTGKMIGFLVLGCVGSLSLLIVIAFFTFKYCKFRGCRVHDSGRLDEPGAPEAEPNVVIQQQPSQTGQAVPALEKKLSQLASMGNAGHLEEFSLSLLLQATNNFSEDHKVGSGSFGSVYVGTVLDSRVPPPTPFEIEAVIYIGYLAADCVTLEGRDRPTMTDVVNSLERALAACLVHPNSLSRSTTDSST